MAEGKSPGLHFWPWAASIHLRQADKGGGDAHNVSLQPLSEGVLPLPLAGHVAGDEGASHGAVQKQEVPIAAVASALLDPLQGHLNSHGGKNQVWTYLVRENIFLFPKRNICKRSSGRILPQSWRDYFLIHCSYWILQEILEPAQDSARSFKNRNSRCGHGC